MPAADIDTILDARRQRRRASLWRALAFGLAALVLVAAIWALSRGGEGAGFAVGPYVARVPVTGVITSDPRQVKLLEDLKDDPNVRAVILEIDSPGGTTVGGEVIFGAVRDLAEAKPTVAVVDTLAASAGYMIAAGAERIWARNGSIVGSIGVIIQYPQAEELLDKLGVEVREVKSAPLKAEPSFFNSTPPAAEAMLQRLVDDSFRWFVDLVADRRPMSRQEVERVADGSVFSGRQAVALRLVDAIGGEDEARLWLAETHAIDADLDTRTRRPPENGGLLGPFARGGAQGSPDAVGSELGERLQRVAPALFLDGLLSIWQG